MFARSRTRLTALLRWPDPLTWVLLLTLLVALLAVLTVEQFVLRLFNPQNELYPDSLQARVFPNYERWEAVPGIFALGDEAVQARLRDFQEGLPDVERRRARPARVSVASVTPRPDLTSTTAPVGAVPVARPLNPTAAPRATQAPVERPTEHPTPSAPPPTAPPPQQPPTSTPWPTAPPPPPPTAPPPPTSAPTSTSAPTAVPPTAPPTATPEPTKKSQSTPKPEPTKKPHPTQKPRPR